jgi:hypothetical protein
MRISLDNYTDSLPFVQRILNSYHSDRLKISAADLLFGKVLSLDRGIFLPKTEHPPTSKTLSLHASKMLKMQDNLLKASAKELLRTDLYYKYKNKHYKVPTFGKIFKMIDFGRAIYQYNSIQFCSDSFARHGDGSTQYNCEPFFDKQKRKVLPNPSFDLCRLACSIYDFIIPEDADLSSLTALQDIINDWTSDDNGVNIMYKKNGRERYPGFQLYKMIARTVLPRTSCRISTSASTGFSRRTWRKKQKR